VSLSPKERERIIEEETLRYETRRNLHKKACAERPVRWPWVVLGALLVYALWAHIFCGSGSCGHSLASCHNMKEGAKCPAHGIWAPEEKSEEKK
jgi:hypothetical protein